MCRTKGIHYKHVTQGRIVGGQRCIIGRLAHIEAHVLKQNDIARQRRNLSPVGRQKHIATDQFSQSSSNGSHGCLLAPFSFLRPAEMRHHDDRGTLIKRRQYRGRRRAQSCIVGDLTLPQRHVQIFSDQHTATGEIELTHQSHCVPSAAAGWEALTSCSHASATSIIRLA